MTQTKIVMILCGNTKCLTNRTSDTFNYPRSEPGGRIIFRILLELAVITYNHAMFCKVHKLNLGHQFPIWFHCGKLRLEKR